MTPSSVTPNSRDKKTTDNRRNGSYPKTVTSSMGEIELDITRDRMGEYETELIPKGTKDLSALEEKVLSLCQGDGRQGHFRRYKYRSLIRGKLDIPWCCAQINGAAAAGA